MVKQRLDTIGEGGRHREGCIRVPDAGNIDHPRCGGLKLLECCGCHSYQEVFPARLGRYLKDLRDLAECYDDVAQLPLIEFQTNECLHRDSGCFEVYNRSEFLEHTALLQTLESGQNRVAGDAQLGGKVCDTSTGVAVEPLQELRVEPIDTNHFVQLNPAKFPSSTSDA